MPTPATLEGIAAALDELLAAQPKPINPSGYTLKDARAYAAANGLTYKLSEDGSTISFFGGPGLGNIPMFIKSVPLTD